MSTTYKGGDVGLIEMYLEGVDLQFRINPTSVWQDLTYKYKEPLDIYRVSNTKYDFRVKPKDIITKVYMHYNDMENKIQKGEWKHKYPNNCMFDNPRGMGKHLEFTFTNGKLTSVEMKEPTK